jgi:hypothetical protein
MTRVCLGAVLAAVLLTGCDVMGSSKSKGPSPKTLSRAQFVRRANRACARAERRTRAFKGSRNFAVVETELRNVFIPAQEHLIVVLRGLAPPPADAAGFQRMLSMFDQLDITIHHFLDAADAQQVQRVKDLVRRLDTLGKGLDKRAAKLGLRTCAKD